MNCTLTEDWGLDPKKNSPRVPRRWQAECLPKMVAYLAQPSPEPAVVSAIMGSGKAQMIAQALACCTLRSDEVVVVSAPTILLVKQLARTIRDRCERGGFMSGPSVVGTYFTEAKDTLQPVIVACTPSLPALAENLRAQGRKTALMVVDECVQVGTLIQTPKGSIRIEELQAGQIVLGYNHETKQVIQTTVKHCFKNPYKGSLWSVDHTLYITPNHPIFSAGEYHDVLDVELFHGGSIYKLNILTPGIVEKKAVIKHGYAVGHDNCFVYNIETGTGNYFAEGVLVHNCHRSETATVHDARDALKPQRLVGFTATPFLADEERRLSLFKNVLHRLTAAEALRDGIVVDWEMKNWDGVVEDGAPVNLNSACLAMTKDAVGPGLFNAKSIADAEDFAEILRKTGKIVETVHSQLSDGELDRRLKAMENGDLWALVHVRMLVEGYDLPCMRFLCLRRPMTSRVDYAQQLGRGMRSFEGKERLVVYDPHDLMATFQITPEEALGGAPTIEDEKLTEGERVQKQLGLFGEEMMKSLSKVRAGKMPLDIKPINTYLTTLVNAFDLCGLIERKVMGRQWRGQPASGKQATHVGKLQWVPTGRRCVPLAHQRALSLLTGRYDTPEERERYATAMTRGTASDLISVLQSLADKKSWPDIKNIDQAVAEGLKQKAEKPAIPANSPALPPAKPAAPAFEQGILFDNKKGQGF